MCRPSHDRRFFEEIPHERSTDHQSARSGLGGRLWPCRGSTFRASTSTCRMASLCSSFTARSSRSRTIATARAQALCDALGPEGCLGCIGATDASDRTGTNGASGLGAGVRGVVAGGGVVPRRGSSRRRGGDSSLRDGDCWRGGTGLSHIRSKSSAALLPLAAAVWLLLAGAVSLLPVIATSLLLAAAVSLFLVVAASLLFSALAANAWERAVCRVRTFSTVCAQFASANSGLVLTSVSRGNRVCRLDDRVCGFDRARRFGGRVCGFDRARRFGASVCGCGRACRFGASVCGCRFDRRVCRFGDSACRVDDGNCRFDNGGDRFD